MPKLSEICKSIFGRSDAQKAASLIRKIAPYARVVFDGDDTLYCTEILAAGVTADLVREFVESHSQDKDPEVVALLERLKMLDAVYVTAHYSGKHFDKQLEEIVRDFAFPSALATVFLGDQELKEQKKLRNLQALENSLPIAGARELLEFMLRHDLKPIELTASDSVRAKISAEASGLYDLMGFVDEHGNVTEQPGKLTVVTIPDTKTLNGKSLGNMKPKPAPDGYARVAEIIDMQPDQMMAAEDSKTGVTSAADAGYAKVGLVALSRKSQGIAGYVDELKPIVGDRGIVIDDSWAPFMQAYFALALKKAREAGVQGLPEELPCDFIRWLEQELPPVARYAARRHPRAPLPEQRL